MRSSLLRLTPVVAALVLVLLMLKEAGVSQARGGVGPIPGNTTIQSFNKAKKLRQQVYAGHEEEYYCGCRFSGNIVDIKSCGYEPKKSLKRAERLKWDHVVPAGAFGQSFREWREGDRRVLGGVWASARRPLRAPHRCVLSRASRRRAKRLTGAGWFVAM
jgi:deoxyribonuclease-1